MGGLVIGGFEPTAKPWVAPDVLPYPFEFQLLEEDWDHFSILMESAIHRIPALQRTGLKKLYNGPESFTPDNQFVLGEAPNLGGFFVGAGFNSVGIASGGGAGRALAEWIVEGEPTSDLVAVDIRRFAPFNANNRWLRDRVGEVLGLHYAVPWPNRELTTARPFRRSPLHHLLANKGPFRLEDGVERPNVFAPAGRPAELDYSWDRPEWLAWSAAEQTATRERVALFDETSFGKLLVVGRDAETVLQRLCTADVAVGPGRAVYTGMLNERAGYEADVTVTRLAPDRYLLVTSRRIAGARRVLDRATLPRQRARQRGRRLLGVRAPRRDGPASRQLLGRLGSADLSDGAFPFATSREIALATRRSERRGSPTWGARLELDAPTEFAVASMRTWWRPVPTSTSSTLGYSRHQQSPHRQGVPGLGTDLTPDHTRSKPACASPASSRPVRVRWAGRAAESAIEAGPRGAWLLRVGTPIDARGAATHPPRRRAGRTGDVGGVVGDVRAAVGLAYVWRRDRVP